MDTRKRLAAILAQVRCDIDASARKLRQVASEAESLGLNATAAIADDAAEVAEEFAAAFAAAYKPDNVKPAVINDIAIRQAISVAIGDTMPTTQPPQVIPAKQSFSLAALLGLR